MGRWATAMAMALAMAMAMAASSAFADEDDGEYDVHIDLKLSEAGDRVDVYIASREEVAGWQFTFVEEGSHEPIKAIEHLPDPKSLAAAHKHTVQTGNKGIVLGISMEGNRIPPTQSGGAIADYLLASFRPKDGEALPSGICLHKVIIASSSAAALKVKTPHCGSVGQMTDSFRAMLSVYKIRHDEL